MKPGVHILRHTFCSHLAMKGAVPRQIQELAGHKDLSTTMRYMHLSPLSRRTIQLLDAPVPGNGKRARKSREFANSLRKSGGGGGSRTLKMSFWQLIDAAVFTGQLIERIPLPLSNRFLWCSPKRPENHSSRGVLAAR